MARRSSLLLLAVLIQLLGPTWLDAQRATSPALAEPRSTLTNLEGRYSFGDLPDGTYTLTFALKGFVPPAATCTMRVMPVDPAIDQKMLKEPDTTKNYTIQVVPPPCQASHPAQPR